MSYERIKSNFQALFKALFPGKLTDKEIDFLQKNLTKKEQVLFYCAPLYDQKHALSVAQTINSALGRKNKTEAGKLYKATLLHDIGKNSFQLGALDRVLQVSIFFLLRPLGNYLADRCLQNKKEGGYLSKMCYCYKYHPQLGSKLAIDAGVEDQGVLELISNHEQPPKEDDAKELILLRQADLLN